MGEFQFASFDVWAPPCCGDESKMVAGCCTDVYAHNQLEEDFQPTVVASLLAADLVINFPQILNLIELKGTDINPSEYCNYKPPLLYEDVHIRVQSFLI